MKGRWLIWPLQAALPPANRAPKRVTDIVRGEAFPKEKIFRISRDFASQENSKKFFRYKPCSEQIAHRVDSASALRRAPAPWSEKPPIRQRWGERTVLLKVKMLGTATMLSVEQMRPEDSTLRIRSMATLTRVLITGPRICRRAQIAYRRIFCKSKT